MKKIILFSLLVLSLSMILAAGCTDSDSTGAAATPTPRIIYVTVTVTPAPTSTHCYWDPATMACSDHPVTTAPPTAAPAAPTTEAPDPILHRWIRQYPGGAGGYEFQFFPDGTVIYDQGNVVTVSRNLKIPAPVITGSGTWTKLSEDHYLVKVSFPGISGAPAIVRQYARVPQYGLLAEHLVSSFEQADVDGATANGTVHSYATDVFYLERAQTD
ncbi:MAG TPA: hypothetical protein VLY83_04570 [Methanoregula sp.]|nr:hypothetical protein [Methanoregula sp.]